MMTDAKMAVAAGLVALSGAAMAETADEAAVQAVVQSMSQAFNAADLAGVMASYRPGAVVMGSPGQTVTGTGPMEEMFHGFFAAGFKVHPGAHEVVVAGDTALHLMAWSSPGPDGSQIRALSVAVMTRDAMGNWRMVIDHPFGDGVMAADPAVAP